MIDWQQEGSQEYCTYILDIHQQIIYIVFISKRFYSISISIQQSNEKIKSNNKNNKYIKEVVLDVPIQFCNNEKEKVRVYKYKFHNNLSYCKRYNIISFFTIMIQINLSVSVLKVILSRASMRINNDSNQFKYNSAMLSVSYFFNFKLIQIFVQNNHNLYYHDACI